MKKRLLLPLFLLLFIFAFSSNSFAESGSGAFISPNCSTVTSPVTNTSWCFDSTNLLLKVWNGSTWATVTPPSYSDHVVLSPSSPVSPTCDTGVSRTSYFYSTGTNLTVNLNNTSCAVGQDLILNYIQTGAVTITYSLTSATILWQANCDTTASCLQPPLSGNGYMDSFKFEPNNVNATVQYVEMGQNFQKPTAMSIANGGTGTGTAPSTFQILVAQSATQYAPETLSGAGDLSSCSINATGVVTCTVVKVNGAAIPTSASLVGTNVSGQFTPVTIGSGLSLASGTLSTTSGANVCSFNVSPGAITTATFSGAAGAYCLSGAYTAAAAISITNANTSLVLAPGTTITRSTAATDLFDVTAAGFQITSDGPAFISGNSVAGGYCILASATSNDKFYSGPNIYYTNWGANSHLGCIRVEGGTDIKIYSHFISPVDSSIALDETNAALVNPEIAFGSIENVSNAQAGSVYRAISVVQSGVNQVEGCDIHDFYISAGNNAGASNGGYLIRVDTPTAGTLWNCRIHHNYFKLLSGGFDRIVWGTGPTLTDGNIFDANGFVVNKMMEQGDCAYSSYPLACGVVNNLFQMTATVDNGIEVSDDSNGVTISNNSFAGLDGTNGAFPQSYCIALITNGGPSMQYATVSNNRCTMIGTPTHTTYGFWLNASASAADPVGHNQITNNLIQCSSTTNTTGIDIQASGSAGGATAPNNYLATNQIIGCGTAINSESTASNTWIGDNALQGNTIAIVRAGTNDIGGVPLTLNFSGTPNSSSVAAITLPYNLYFTANYTNPTATATCGTAPTGSADTFTVKCNGVSEGNITLAASTCAIGLPTQAAFTCNLGQRFEIDATGTPTGVNESITLFGAKVQ